MFPEINRTAMIKNHDVLYEYIYTQEIFEICNLVFVFFIIPIRRWSNGNSLAARRESSRVRFPAAKRYLYSINIFWQ